MDHPVTRSLFRYLGSKRQEMMESWANGEMDAPNFEEQLLINAAARGSISVLNELLKIDHEVLRGSDE